ncbi:MAG: Hin recombinase [Iphinoe sp. HA4291-MV1]|nr:Hin recombinase [Iphinoe sp. HA4291-MV1]
MALAKGCGAYEGRKKSLNPAQIVEIRARAANGVNKTQLAREFHICRKTLYQYLRGS